MWPAQKVKAVSRPLECKCPVRVKLSLLCQWFLQSIPSNHLVLLLCLWFVPRFGNIIVAQASHDENLGSDPPYTELSPYFVSADSMENHTTWCNSPVATLDLSTLPLAATPACNFKTTEFRYQTSVLELLMASYLISLIAVFLSLANRVCKHQVIRTGSGNPYTLTVPPCILNYAKCSTSTIPTVNFESFLDIIFQLTPQRGKAGSYLDRSLASRYSSLPFNIRFTLGCACFPDYWVVPCISRLNMVLHT